MTVTGERVRNPRGAASHLLGEEPVALKGRSCKPPVPGPQSCAFPKDHSGLVSYSIWGCKESDTTEELTLMNITDFLTNREF